MVLMTEQNSDFIGLEAVDQSNLMLVDIHLFIVMINLHVDANSR